MEAQVENIRIKQVAIFFGYFLLFAIPLFWPPASYLLTKDKAYSWNDQARMGTVESLVERHTFKIEYSKYGLFTGDKIMHRSSFYATKPPVLSFIGGLVYAPLHHVWPLLHGGEKMTYWDYEHIIYPFVTLFTMGISSALMLMFLYKALLLLDMEERFRWWIVFIVAFGSLIFTYTTVFNNHAFAAAWLFIGFYFVLRSYLSRTKEPAEGEAKPIRPRRLDGFLAGVCISLAGVCDLSGALAFLPLVFIMMLFARHLWRLAPFFILGTLVFLIPHLFFNWKITGDPWTPIYMMRAAYLTSIPGYYGEVFNQAEVHWYSPQRWLYIFHALFGQRGAFLYTPALLFGFAGLFVAIRRNTYGLRLPAIAALLGIGASWFYICFWPANWGGTSYGLRYAVTATPLLIFFAAPLFEGMTKVDWKLILFRDAGIIGGLLAFIGAVYPWGASGFLPQTNFSLAENLEFIGIDLLNWLLPLAK